MKKGKVLALDYGKKRVGVASGDLETRIAFPRDVLLNKETSHLVEQIKVLCDELGVSLIVVGLPLNMDYEDLENEMVQEVRYFSSLLTRSLDGVTVKLFDERLSSFEAENLIKEIMEKSGQKRQKALGRDAYAAQVILQRFFDKLEH